MKKNVKQVLGFLVCANTAIFLLLAYLHKLPTDAKAAIFIDFWGRFTRYARQVGRPRRSDPQQTVQVCLGSSLLRAPDLTGISPASLRNLVRNAG